jgi:hypothetical protein
MNATIKLKQITKLDSNIDLANLELKLEIEALDLKAVFLMTSTGLSLRVTSEHSTDELIKLCKWLNKSSKDETNLRTNESELRLFAKEMIKTNRKLNQAKKL